ncbi:hypothetical protein MMC30_007317 [Trapelia coarctata]|nr:hypothetical protein [Trapelia coarctata]
MSNQASWIHAAKAPVVLGDAEIPTPGPGEILVKITSIAFSPIDAKIQKFGTYPIPYPDILGTSFAGLVESVGPDVATFQKGDKVAAIRIGKNIVNPHFGAFQKYGLATISSTAKLLPSTPLPEAAAVILNLCAVVSALSIHLSLARPPLSGAPEPQGKKVLIYGGSSASGQLAVKYATSAGYTVVTTSSPQNREFVTSLGPAYIIDHTLPPADIVAELNAQGPYHKIFDTIGLPPVTDIMVEYLSSLGGGSYNTFIPLLGSEKPIPENVERKFAPYSWAFEEDAHKHVAKWFYEEYVPQGLENGLIVPNRLEVIEGGLGKIQDALDLMLRGGVSGKKLVMDPWA